MTKANTQKSPLGIIIHAARQEAGIKLSDLATKTGVDYARLFDFECLGKRLTSGEIGSVLLELGLCYKGVDKVGYAELIIGKLQSDIDAKDAIIARLEGKLYCLELIATIILSSVGIMALWGWL
jgi:hypothetical protein